MGFKNTIDFANYVDSLKVENERLKAEIENITIDKRNQELRADLADDKIKSLKADKAQAEENAAFWKKKADDYHLMSDIRRGEKRQLKRALWLARADRAKTETDYYIDYEYSNTVLAKRKRNKWYKVERLCRKKAEEAMG